jgi:hypothetical protein
MARSANAAIGIMTRADASMSVRKAMMSPRRYVPDEDERNALTP